MSSSENPLASICTAKTSILGALFHSSRHSPRGLATLPEAIASDYRISENKVAISGVSYQRRGITSDIAYREQRYGEELGVHFHTVLDKTVRGGGASCRTRHD